MHSFSLVVGSLLGHPWAKDIIKKAQKVVTYFNASTRGHSLLMLAAAAQNIKGKLQTSNTTRFTSVHIMLQSVLNMDQPLHAVLNQHAADIKQDEVKHIIGDRQFWAAADVLSKLLNPFSQVVMAIQAKTATVADVTRYWLYLARCFKAELPKLAYVGGEIPGHTLMLCLGHNMFVCSLECSTDTLSILSCIALADFQKHCIVAFNRRCAELNLPLCRMALFLDPRYKAAVDTPQGFRSIVRTVSRSFSVYNLIVATVYKSGSMQLRACSTLQALGVMKNRGYSGEDCSALITQLQAYKISRAPFDALLGKPEDFSAQHWWRSIDESLIIVQLAVFLYDGVPHAATVERLFSIMGWYHSAVRNRLGVGTTGRMSAIKTFHEQSQPS